MILMVIIIMIIIVANTNKVVVAKQVPPPHPASRFSNNVWGGLMIPGTRTASWDVRLSPVKTQAVAAIVPRLLASLTVARLFLLLLFPACDVPPRPPPSRLFTA